MSIKINPYLSFNGDAEQAIQLYQQALGAELKQVMRWSEMPEHDCAPEDRDRIMHASLHIDGTLVMLADSPQGQPKSVAGNVQICLTFDDVSELQRRFDALSVGGKVIMAVHDAFWGDRFGMLTDAHGVQWMFVCPLQGKAG